MNVEWQQVSAESKRLWRGSDLSQMVAIERLHDFAQALVAVIFLVPHIFVVFDLALVVEG